MNKIVEINGFKGIVSNTNTRQLSLEALEECINYHCYEHKTIPIELSNTLVLLANEPNYKVKKIFYGSIKTDAYYEGNSEVRDVIIIATVWHNVNKYHWHLYAVFVDKLTEVYALYQPINEPPHKYYTILPYTDITENDLISDGDYIFFENSEGVIRIALSHAAFVLTHINRYQKPAGYYFTWLFPNINDNPVDIIVERAYNDIAITEAGYVVSQDITFTDVLYDVEQINYEDIIGVRHTYISAISFYVIDRLNNKYVNTAWLPHQLGNETNFFLPRVYLGSPDDDGYLSVEETSYVVIPEIIVSNINPVTYSWTDLSIPREQLNGIPLIQTTVKELLSSGNTYKVNYLSVEAFLSELNLSETGWILVDYNTLRGLELTLTEPISITNTDKTFGSNSKPIIYYAFTQVINGKDEYVLKFGSLDITQETQNFFLKVSYTFRRLDYRVTHLRFYIKQGSSVDYELYQEISFEHTRFNVKGKMNVLNQGLGKFLTQAIDYYIVAGKEYEYYWLPTFRHYINVRGYKVINYYNKLYYSAIGNGYITDIFYAYHQIDIQATRIYALAELNGNIAVFTEKGLKILSIDTTYGLTFSITDALDYVIKDENDVVSLSTGLYIHTEEGIWFTNGYNKELLSDVINDIIKVNYSRGSIYGTMQALFYYIHGEKYYYVLNFYRRYWEKHSLGSIKDITGALVLTFLYNQYYACIQTPTATVLVKTDISEVEHPITSDYVSNAQLRTVCTDFGLPNVWKRLYAVYIDYEGNGTLKIYMDNEDITYILKSGSRTTDKYYVNLDKMIPFKSIQIAIDGPTIYSIRLVLNLMEDRT